MLRKLVEKDKSKKEKYDNIDDETKEVGINEVAETDNDELVVDSVNDARPPQDAMTTTTAAAAGEGGDDADVVAEDGTDGDEADDTKGGWRGGKSGGQRRQQKRKQRGHDGRDGRSTPLVAHRVERLKCLNTER